MSLAPRGSPAPPNRLLEGVGARHREAGRSWTRRVVEPPPPERRRRALERDGAAYEGHWDQWAAQEEEYLAEDPVGVRGPSTPARPRGARPGGWDPS
ncbi:hypothetical protein QJS66_17990 [Kocuria rhizophila]|nr:hypothetical protein QJS66_17990 [Kocuria rhizophila]